MLLPCRCLLLCRLKLLLQRVLHLLCLPLQVAAVLAELSLALRLLCPQLLRYCTAAGNVLHCLISSSCHCFMATPAAGVACGQCRAQSKKVKHRSNDASATDSY